MPRVLSLLAVLVFFSVPLLIGEQGIPAKEDWCQEKPIGASCWMELSDQPGCYVWDSYLFPDETKTWMGECVGGLAQGSGTLSAFSTRSRKILESTGNFQQGKQHGYWIERAENGTVHDGPFVEGQRHGNWVVRDADGKVSGGPFAEGKAQGQWILRDKDGNIQVGPMVHGRMHGRWVERWTDERGVQEGPFVEGKMHGRWILRDKDGNQEVVTFNNGERAG